MPAPLQFQRDPEGYAIPLLLDEVGAATYSGIGRFKLRALRRERRGPVIVLVGRSVRYRPEDLNAYVNANRIEPAALPPVEHRAARATGGRALKLCG